MAGFVRHSLNPNGGTAPAEKLALSCQVKLLAWYQPKVEKAVKSVVEKRLRSAAQPETDAPHGLHIVPAAGLPQLGAQVTDVGFQ